MKHKLKYRIVETDKGFYPHVKIKKFLFWSKWKKIGKHPSGCFGLYDLSNQKYPSTKEEAERTIRLFNDWYKIWPLPIISEQEISLTN